MLAHGISGTGGIVGHVMVENRMGDAPGSASGKLEAGARDAAAVSGAREQEAVRIIAESALFDAQWYRANHPNVADSGLAPELHYLRVGAAHGLLPSPLFDAAAYLARYPDVASSKVNPLLHYMLFGKSEGRIAMPAAELPAAAPPPQAPAPEAAPVQPIPPPSEQENSHVKTMAGSGLFDSAWYVAKYPEAAHSGLSPELHYLRQGHKDGHAPSPAFDGAGYLARYPDIARTGANPLVHYLLHGRKEGRRIAAADPEEMLCRLAAASGLFDEAWYVSSYPEVAASGLPPLRYFLRHGREKGHNPSLRFDSAAYIAANRDVAGSSVNPLRHYLEFGRGEGRLICDVTLPPKPEAVTAAPAPAAPQAPATPPDAAAREAFNAQLIAGSGLFDAKFYTASHPDVAASGLTPEVHYLRIGGTAGLPPSPRFDGGDYLARYRDVRDAGLNPLVHFLSFGRAEKRKFRDWDPIESLVEPIMVSGLYDEEWYVRTYPELLKSKHSPLGHFIKHGREKGHSPGPLFDAAAYMADNPELHGTRVNPLVHYLQFGKSRGRPIFPVSAAGNQPEPQAAGPVTIAPLPPEPQSEPVAEAAPPAAAVQSAEELAADIALIAASPLFDKDWYMRKYPDAAKSGLSAAEHYLRHGASELRQPGILFDPHFYTIEQSPEIQKAKINPLLHFIKEGQKLGRKPRALFQAMAPAEPFRPLSPSSWPLAAADVAPVAVPRPWARQSELTEAPGEGALFAGETLLAARPAATVLAAAKPLLAAFRHMSGLAETNGLAIRRDGGLEALPATGFEPRSYRGLGPAFTAGPAKLVDAWYAAGRTLRLRLGEDDKPGASLLVLRAFQAQPDSGSAPTMVAEAALDGTVPGFVDLNLVSAFMPVLLVLSEAEGQATEIGLLPFPSLCRGGMHYAELVGIAQVSNPIQRLQAQSDHFARAVMAAGSGGLPLVGSIKVALRGASGAEPIFASGISAWIARVFNVSVSAAASGEAAGAGGEYLTRALAERGPAQDEDGRSGQCSLLLPPDCIPTISALTAVAGNAAAAVRPGSFFVTDGLSARPRLSVQLPRVMPDLLALQPDWALPAFPVLEPQAAENQAPGLAEAAAAGDFPHLAIRFVGGGETNRAAMLMPLAPDAARPVIAGAAAETGIDVVIRATTPKALATAVGSLLAQRGVSIAFVRAEHAGSAAAAPALQAVLDALAPGRGDVLTLTGHSPVGPGAIIAGSDNHHTLVIDDAVVLHDPRTLETLLALLRDGKTASAGCVMLRDAVARRGSALQFESGGYFPSHVSLLASPRLILSLPDLRGALPAASYPVAANDPALVLLSNAALLAAGDPDDPLEASGLANLAFSLGALAAGYRHLCTSAVRATVTGPLPPREAADPPGIGRLPAASWESLLNAVTVLRELH